MIILNQKLKAVINKTLLKMKKYISNKGYVSKRELKAYLNWGIRIPFDSYRNKLRKYVIYRLRSNLI